MSLICPNCKEALYLCEKNTTVKDWGIFDRWSCHGCTHIEVLDFRASDEKDLMLNRGEEVTE